MATRGVVLVVDDDPLIVELLELALEEDGYTVSAAMGSAALAAAQELQPAVILLDIMMPGMDGIEVSQRLRADPTTRDIPIIVMSAGERLRATATLMPVNDRVAKPFELPTLYGKVARWTQSAPVTPKTTE